jgi:hypothetical protein
VILSQTLQAMRNVEACMREMLRVGARASSRSRTSATGATASTSSGHMPVSRTLPHNWYDTPNIHLCTVKDFEDLCVKLDAEILDERVINEGGHRARAAQLDGQPGRVPFSAEGVLAAAIERALRAAPLVQGAHQLIRGRLEFLRRGDRALDRLAAAREKLVVQRLRLRLGLAARARIPGAARDDDRRHLPGARM